MTSSSEWNDEYCDSTTCVSWMADIVSSKDVNSLVRCNIVDKESGANMFPAKMTRDREYFSSSCEPCPSSPLYSSVPASTTGTITRLDICMVVAVHSRPEHRGGPLWHVLQQLKLSLLKCLFALRSSRRVEDEGDHLAQHAKRSLHEPH